MKYLIATLALLLTLNTQAQNLIELDDFPTWFKKSAKREAKVNTQSDLQIKEFNIDTKVKGDYKLIEQAQGTWYYNIQIGTESPVECYIFTVYDGPSNSLYAILENALQGVEKLNNRSLSRVVNFAIDSGTIGNTPYLLLDLLYTLGEGDKKVSGVLKGLSAKTDNGLQICIHNELGYQETFFSVFESFINAVSKNDKNAAFFQPIYQMTLNGIPVGYGKETYTVDADGDVEITTESALMFPIDYKSIARSDSVSRSWSKPDGSLINATMYAVENSKLTSQFSIVNQDQKWHVEGQLQEKEVKKVMDYDGPLLSNFGSYLETAKLAQSQTNSAQFKMWMPEADPTSDMNVVLSKLKGKNNANFHLTMGPIMMEFLAKENGLYDRGTIAQGGIKMGLELIAIQGEPLLP